MAWSDIEIIAMLRRARDLGALVPGPHADPQVGAASLQDLDVGIDPDGEPVHEPHPGPEV